VASWPALPSREFASAAASRASARALASSIDESRVSIPAAIAGDIRNVSSLMHDAEPRARRPIVIERTIEPDKFLLIYRNDIA